MAAPKDNAHWLREPMTADECELLYKDPGSYVLGRYEVPKRTWNGNNPQSDGIKNLEENDPCELARLRILAQDFKSLLYQTGTSDCCIKVGEETYFYVHKSVLAARSNAFANAIINKVGEDTRESSKSQNKVAVDIKNNKWMFEIENVDPEVMRLAIIFMYTGSCTLNSKAEHLANVAGSLDIESLKVYVAHYLVKQISVENFKRLIKSAYGYKNELLRQGCINFFNHNAKAIMGNCKEWTSFAKENPHIVLDLLCSNVDPESFLQQQK